MFKAKLKKSIILFTLLVSCLTCWSQKETVIINGESIEAIAGPNLVKISDNFYADRTEVTNLFYKEYLHWLKTVYGVSSKQYIDAQPNASVWNAQNETEINHEEYLLSSAYNDYPLVGITLHQAKMYSQWRTDRVTQMRLVMKGYLKAIPPNQKNYFSIEKYEAGSIELLRELDSDFAFHRYTVPTIEEWEALAGINSRFKKRKDNLNVPKNSYFAGSKKENPHGESKFIPTKLYTDGQQNIFGLYHTIGNVSELVDSNGIAKGGNWKYPMDNEDLKNNKKQNIPNCWTGFRNVSRLEFLKKRRK